MARSRTSKLLAGLALSLATGPWASENLAVASTLAGLSPSELTDCGDYQSPGFGPDGFDDFSLTLASPDTVRLETRDGEGGCQIHAKVDVLDSMGATVASSGEAVGNCSRLILALAAGQYTVRIHGSLLFKGGSLDPYALQYYTGSCSICGNGIIEAEECDDGNVENNDSCSANCEPELRVLEACGLYASSGFGLQSSNQFSLTLESDDTVRVETTDGAGGCPGDTRIYVRPESGSGGSYNSDDDGGVGECSRLMRALPAGEYTVIVSGGFDNTVGPYVLEYFAGSCSVCGNGILEAEHCDGNELGACFDGPCSGSCNCPFGPQCGDSVVQSELGEECDDGNPSNGDGCDATCRRETRFLETCGPFQSSGFPDEGFDSFSFTLHSPQTIHLETTDGEGGCPGGTRIGLYDASGGYIADDDDNGAGYCSRLIRSLPAGKYLVSVLGGDGFNSLSELPPYQLEFFTEACSTCGNGLVEAEQCDDGNSLDSDGCSAICRIESRLLEACGPYQSSGVDPGEFDLYSFTLDQKQTVRLETTNGHGGCPGESLIELYNSAEVLVASDVTGGIGLCGRVIKTLSAGQYTVRVSSFFGGGVAPYVLEYRTSECSTCGDSIVEAEECDDGNVANGDGCDTSCRREIRAMESCGPYDPTGFALGNFDEFSFSLVSENTVRLETTNGTGGCPGDTTLFVYDSDGAYLTDDGDDGAGKCSRIVQTLPGGEYSVRVWAPRVNPYVLEFHTGSCSTCGNETVEAEECDDGNLIDHDGCDASCRVDRRALTTCGPYQSAGFLRGDVEEFSLTLEADDRVHVETSIAGDCFPNAPEVAVYDSLGELVSSGMHGGVGVCRRVFGLLVAGEYTVRVSPSPYSISNVGPYVLRLFTGACSTCGNEILEAEECDDGNQANGDTCDSDCVHREPLNGCGDHAFPGFPANGSERLNLFLDSSHLIHLETMNSGNSCSVDTVLDVYDSQNVLVASDDQGGQGNCSALTLQLAAGTYRLAVRGYNGTGLGPFLLRYQSDACSVCGNAIVELAENCDDGNTESADGEFCRSSCRRRPCGQPVNSGDPAPKASDALFTLRAAVGAKTCDLRVCDINDDEKVAAGDALGILRLAIGAAQDLRCPE